MISTFYDNKDNNFLLKSNHFSLTYKISEIWAKREGKIFIKIFKYFWLKPKIR